MRCFFVGNDYRDDLIKANINADRSYFQDQLYTGRNHLRNGHLHRAVCAFKLALAAGVEPAQAHYNLGIAYKKTGALIRGVRTAGHP